MTLRMSFQTRKAVADELAREVGLGQLINRPITRTRWLTQMSGPFGVAGRKTRRRK